MIRKIFIAKKKKITVDIPEEYINKKVEILILPYDIEYMVETGKNKKQITLSTFKCGGKLNDFKRNDAYNENI